MSDPGPIKMVPTKSDAQIAADTRAELMPLLDKVCEVVSEARRSGLNVQFNLGPDPFGKQRVQFFDISKSLL